MQRIAGIDAGSNALRMMIGNVTPGGQVEPLENVRLPVRLGQDVFASGSIREKTMQRAVDAFVHFRRIAQDFGVTAIRAIATSAMREAANSDTLLDRINRTSGIEIEVISGAEEARLIHQAVDHAVHLRGKRAVVVDIGGGSVEVTISENRNILSTESYNMGTVRLLQKLSGGKDGGFEWFGAKHRFTLLVREYAEAARRRIHREIGNAHVNVCVGTGGAVDDLGRLHQKVFKKSNDRLVTVGELDTLIKELDGMSLKQRIRKFGLRPDRADVILPAAIVLQLIAHEARVRQVTIPHVGLKDGVLLDMAEGLRKGPHATRRVQVLQAAIHLGRKYQFDAQHAALAAKLARQLFDQSRELHNLGDEERMLLEAAAMLHDVGHFINTADHQQHGYYILKANHLTGLSDRQQELVANVVRYHRKAYPSSEDANLKRLPQRERLTVSKLSALLRLADGMDVSHTGHVTGAVLTEKKKRWKLTLKGSGDLMLERWALDKRGRLFEEIFGVPLEIAEKK